MSSRGLAAPKTFVEGATALGGAPRGAENFEKFRYFIEKSPNFVKVEDFIAQLCIK